MNKSKDFYPLLTSPIWQEQKKYYQKTGESAWAYVPFLYTSNKFMAHWIADIIVNISKSYPEEKIQILELGSGHGMFSYFLYKRLKDLNVEFVLTISDFIASNLEYLQSLPQWENIDVNWMALNDVDDLEEQYDFDGVNFVVANYFFDSLPNDGFEMVDGKWQKAFLSTRKEKNKVEGFVDIGLSFESRPCDLTQDEKTFLSRYEGVVDHVLVPTAVKKIVDKFKSSEKPAYFFVNDKGFTSKNKMNYSDNYAYKCDGAMATMVNFDGIRHWIESNANDFFVINENNYDDSHFVIFSVNNPNKQLQQIANMALSGPSWNMVFKLFMVFEEQPEMSFEDACFYVECSEYDEAMLSRISGFFMNQVKLHGELIHQLKPLLLKVLNSFYWHPARMMYYYTVIDLLILCGVYEKATHLLDTYKHLVPSQYDVLLREGIIQYKLKNQSKSKELFKKVLKISPKCKEAKRYLDLLQ